MKSTYEQTPMKDLKESKKPVYCYQCAQKGHYGHVIINFINQIQNSL